MHSTMILHALRPFISTERGQVSVDIDSELLLLSDTHWYWWFVRDSKSGGEGFVPAEILELPNERLARLNRQMNIHLPSSPLEPSPCAGHKRSKSVHFALEACNSFSSLELLDYDDSSPIDSSDSEDSLVSSLDSDKTLSHLHIDDNIKHGDAKEVHIRAEGEADAVDVLSSRPLSIYT